MIDQWKQVRTRLRTRHDPRIEAWVADPEGRVIEIDRDVSEERARVLVERAERCRAERARHGPTHLADSCYHPARPTLRVVRGRHAEAEPRVDAG